MTDMLATAHLEARSITVGYSNRHVLRDLTLSVPPGRFTALLGPNGSGKSTLLRALAGLARPSSGDVMLNAVAIRTMSRRQIARHLSLLPQTPRAPDDISVHDLVAQGRYPHRGLFKPWSARDQAICARAMEMTAVSDLESTSLGHLSGGQRQRAWIAMTLAQSADMLLLDEPTTYLDIAHQLDILDLLRRLVHNEGKTIVAVLHDINHAARFADHICLLKQGEIVVVGPPREVICVNHLRTVFSIDATVIDDPVDCTPLCIARK